MVNIVTVHAMTLFTKDLPLYINLILFYKKWSHVYKFKFSWIFVKSLNSTVAYEDNPPRGSVSW